MASEKQVTANCRNATKSTDLKMDNGKTAALSTKMKAT
jgi:hypothetical protein